MGRPKDPALERVWRRRLERHSMSGISTAAFCTRERVTVASFYYWRRRLATEAPPAPQCPPVFVPLHVGRPAYGGDGAVSRNVEVDLPHHVRLRFDALPEPEWLGRVVAALASLPDQEAAP